MLASGQMGFDIQKEYISRNRFKRNAAIRNKPPPEERSVPVQNPNPTASVLEENVPEEHFKTVKDGLKLNQSAMTEGKEQIANQKLDDLALKSDYVLLKVSTFWPFTLFVNHIIVDPYKVNIIFREFFWSEHIHSVMIKDILDVVVETSVFFATVRIVDQGYIENTIDVAYLKKGDALRLRKIIQGLIIAHRQAVDLSVLSSSDIRSKTEEMGKVKGIDTDA